MEGEAKNDPRMGGTMHIELPADQQALVENLVVSGRFPSVEDAVGEAIRLLAAQERLRREIQVGVDRADRGELLDHDTVFGQLRSTARPYSPGVQVSGK